MAADYNGLDYGSAQLLVRHLRMHPLKMKRCLDRENREVNLETAQSSVSDPDPLFPNVDSRIRIRIHVKMRWIRNAGWNFVIFRIFLDDLDSSILRPTTLFCSRSTCLSESRRSFINKYLRYTLYLVFFFDILNSQPRSVRPVSQPGTVHVY